MSMWESAPLSARRLSQDTHSVGNQTGGQLTSARPQRAGQGTSIMRNTVWVIIGLLALTIAGFGVSSVNPQQDTTSIQSMSVADLEKAGDNSRAQKDYDQAIKYFKEAVRKDNRNAKLYNKLGLAELSQGGYEAAQANFAKAAKYDHKYPEAWNDLGVVYYLQKNYTQAAKYFSKALALTPDRASFHVNLGITWFTMNKIDRAMAEYTRALQLDPDALVHGSHTGMSAQITTREDRAKLDYLMAKVYAGMGNVDGSLESLKKAKENGFGELDGVYKDQEFARVRQDPRLAEIIPPPAAK